MMKNTWGTKSFGFYVLFFFCVIKMLCWGCLIKKKVEDVKKILFILNRGMMKNTRTKKIGFYVLFFFVLLKMLCFQVADFKEILFILNWGMMMMMKNTWGGKSFVFFLMFWFWFCVVGNASAFRLQMWKRWMDLLLIFKCLLSSLFRFRYLEDILLLLVYLMAPYTMGTLLTKLCFLIFPKIEPLVALHIQYQLVLFSCDLYLQRGMFMPRTGTAKR